MAECGIAERTQCADAHVYGPFENDDTIWQSDVIKRGSAGKNLERVIFYDSGRHYARRAPKARAYEVIASFFYGSFVALSVHAFFTILAFDFYKIYERIGKEFLKEYFKPSNLSVYNMESALLAVIKILNYTFLYLCAALLINARSTGVVRRAINFNFGAILCASGAALGAGAYYYAYIAVVEYLENVKRRPLEFLKLLLFFAGVGIVTKCVTLRVYARQRRRQRACGDLSVNKTTRALGVYACEECLKNDAAKKALRECVSDDAARESRETVRATHMSAQLSMSE